MLTKTEKSFSFLFFIIVIAELVCSSIDSLNQLHYITKPAVVIVLIFFFWKQSKHLNKSIIKPIISALMLSLLGDILLMFVDISPNYFMFGLVSFLLAHLMYVIVFLKHKNKSKRALPFIGVLLAYAGGLFYFLNDGLGEMLIPVVVYMVVILAMATTAFLRKGMVNSNSYNLVFIGAILFMISDSILALNKFYQSLDFSNISIMLTYALAQYCIVLGILKLSKSPR